MMKIKITSPCMAMLVYEAAKAGGQTEGCLYGEVAQEITKNITDSDVTTSVEDVLSVNSIGSLQLPECSSNTEIQNTNIHGWFRFCRRPLLRLTVREKSIHRKLAKNLASKNKAPAHIVTILMQERWSENHSTYLWKFAAFLQRDRWFVPCRIEIVNLKASTCGSYKPYPSFHQQQMLPQVTNSLSTLNSSFASNSNNASFDMVQTVRNTGQEIVKSLNETISNLRTTEEDLESAYAEQESLKRTLSELQALMNKKTNRGDRENRSSDNCDSVTESSDSGDYYGDAKQQEPFNEASSDGESNLGPSTSLSAIQSISTSPYPSQGKVLTPVNNGEPPPPYDPFDSLVHIVKADLKKEVTTPEKLTNDEHATNQLDNAKLGSYQ